MTADQPILSQEQPTAVMVGDHRGGPGIWVRTALWLRQLAQLEVHRLHGIDSDAPAAFHCYQVAGYRNGRRCDPAITLYSQSATVQNGRPAHGGGAAWASAGYSAHGKPIITQACNVT